MDTIPFQARVGATFYIANAVTASASAALSFDSEQVVLYNSSFTAVAYFHCQTVPGSADTGVVAVIPTTAQAPAVGAMPIPPQAQIRLTVGHGHKRFSVIASAADGNLYITPGKGN